MQLLCYLRTAQAKKSKFGNVMPVVVVFCNLFCIHFLHKYSFRKVKYLMLRKSDAAKLRVTFVSLNKNVYKIDRNYIGDDITIVCKATYAASGTPASTPGISDPAVSTVIRRRIPKIEADWEGVPTGVPDGTYVIFPRPVIRDTMGLSRIRPPCLTATGTSRRAEMPDMPRLPTDTLPGYLSATA